MFSQTKVVMENRYSLLKKFKVQLIILYQKFSSLLPPICLQRLVASVSAVLLFCCMFLVSYSNNSIRQRISFRFQFRSSSVSTAFLMRIPLSFKYNNKRSWFPPITRSRYQALLANRATSPWFSNPSVTPVTLSQFPLPHNSHVRQEYVRLVSAYLRPHLLNGRKISRHSFLHPFKEASGVCTACALIQVRNGSIYVYDPHGVRAVMAPFRAQRLREVVYWVSSSVARGVVDNFEFVVSTMDPIPSTSRSHSYRLPRPSKQTPIFAPVYCNVSDNIPFPVMLTDVLRRGLPDIFANRSHSTIAEWDDAMEHFANGPALHIPWPLKISRAVFRGTIRSSAFVQRLTDFNDLCRAFGRTALWEIANQQSHIAKSVANAIAKSFRVWPFPAHWFQPHLLPVLDVQIEGTCGGKLYVASRLNPAQQAAYKCTIHAAGNFFWADRLFMTLFGSNVILKQDVPCGMFFEPMLRPFVHFIPINANFSNAASMALWAFRHDDIALKIVQRARKFAEQFLSSAGVQTYVDELLIQYAAGLENRTFPPMRGAMHVFP